MVCNLFSVLDLAGIIIFEFFICKGLESGLITDQNFWNLNIWDPCVSSTTTTTVNRLVEFHN